MSPEKSRPTDEKLITEAATRYNEAAHGRGSETAVEAQRRFLLVTRLLCPEEAGERLSMSSWRDFARETYMTATGEELPIKPEDARYWRNLERLSASSFRSVGDFAPGDGRELAEALMSQDQRIQFSPTPR